MRALAQAWPTLAIVQQAVAQLPWSRIATLLEKLKEPGARNWYAAQSLDPAMRTAGNRGRGTHA